MRLVLLALRRLLAHGRLVLKTLVHLFLAVYELVGIHLIVHWRGLVGKYLSHVEVHLET